MIGLDDLCLATGGQLYGEAAAREFTGISDNPDRVKPGDLFVVGAIPECGQDADIARAVAAGASGLLCEAPPVSETAAVTTILVGDARLALEQWTAFILRQNHPVIVGVVGSLGKTSVCEAIAAGLGSRHAVYTSARSHGGPYSLATGVSGLEPIHRFAVLELSPDEFNTLDDMVSILQPQLLVVTGAASLMSVEARSASRLSTSVQAAIAAMPPRSAVVASMNDRGWLKPSDTASPRMVTYGDSARMDLPDAFPDVAADNIRFSVDGLTLSLRVGKENLKDVRLPGLGLPALNAALCALAACVALDVPAKDAVSAMAGMGSLGGLRLAVGSAGSALVDASSGAQPETAIALLEWLGLVKDQFRRRFLVLGDFEPVGDGLVEACHQIGRRAAVAADAVIACDDAASPAVLAARRAGLAEESTFLPRQREEAAAFVRSELGRGDIMIVAGRHASSTAPILSTLAANGTETSRGLPVSGVSDIRPRHGLERSWLEIDRRALAANVKLIKRQLESGVRLMTVVRDDGFRHGAIEVASTVLRNGADMLSVLTIEEGLALRSAGFDCPVLVTGLIPANHLHTALDADLTVTVHGQVGAELLIRCARRMKTRAKYHIRVAHSVRDAGVQMRELVALVRHLKKADQVILDGLFIEFSSLPGASWAAECTRQLQQLTQILRNLSAAGVEIPHIHAAGSAALLTVPGSVFTVARIGHLIYGVSPFPTISLPQGLRPALTWKTTVADFTSETPKSSARAEVRRMAVIPVGHREGVARSQRGQASALVGGIRAPITDLIGPDWTGIDVTTVPSACVGSEVVLIGKQGTEQITVEEIAAQRNCASIDVILSLPSRLPKLYVP